MALPGVTSCPQTHAIRSPLHPLTAVEARVLATLMEKARTVPDSYPLTLNALVTGCNQKSSRDPVMEVSEGEAQEALDSLRLRTMSVQISSARATRWEHNFPRGVGVPDQSAVLLSLLMLRGPQTAGELRINSERWHRFADISSVEAFLEELRERSEEKAARWSSCCPARPARTTLGPPAVRPRGRERDRLGPCGSRRTRRCPGPARGRSGSPGTPAAGVWHMSTPS